MRFVVPVPFWLYAIFVLFCLALGGIAFGIAAAVGLILVIIRWPVAALSVVVLALAVRFWPVAVPILFGLWFYGTFIVPKSKESSKTALVSKD